MFEIESLANGCLFRPKRLRDLVLPFRGFQPSPFSLLPHEASKFGRCLEGETGRVFEALQVSNFVTPAPREHQSLCWFLCPPVGTFCQGPRQDSQPLAAPRIGK